MTDMEQLLGIYSSPGQAFWRWFELHALRQVDFPRPVLEIGCGTGRFTALRFDHVEEAIDLNPRSVEASRQLGLYGNVRCLDARDLVAEPDRFGTIYANCVIEHLPDIDTILKACAVSLRPGGRMVVTVPLPAMEDHLLLPSRRWAALRRRQLVHLNLFDTEDWERRFMAQGFEKVTATPYLFASQCKFWDTVDGPGCIGSGRYTLSNALSLVAGRVLPAKAKEAATRRLAAALERRARRPVAPGEEPCAAVVVAEKTPA